MDTITRKTATKSHIIKIGHKEYITFEHYRSLLLNKRYESYGGTIDIIEDVTNTERFGIEYHVIEEDTKNKRVHGTYINLNKLFKV